VIGGYDFVGDAYDGMHPFAFADVQALRIVQATTLPFPMKTLSIVTVRPNPLSPLSSPNRLA
jgi:hypothetical protein